MCLLTLCRLSPPPHKSVSWEGNSKTTMKTTTKPPLLMKEGTLPKAFGRWGGCRVCTICKPFLTEYNKPQQNTIPPLKRAEGDVHRAGQAHPPPHKSVSPGGNSKTAMKNNNKKQQKNSPPRGGGDSPENLREMGRSPGAYYMQPYSLPHEVQQTTTKYNSPGFSPEYFWEGGGGCLLAKYKQQQITTSPPKP
jgi:hypothetical protein